MKRKTQTVKEVVSELAANYHRPFTTQSGHEYQGDIFYSDLRRYLKNRNMHSKFQDVCDGLRAAGLWVHS